MSHKKTRKHTKRKNGLVIEDTDTRNTREWFSFPSNDDRGNPSQFESMGGLEVLYVLFLTVILFTVHRLLPLAFWGFTVLSLQLLYAIDLRRRRAIFALWIAYGALFSALDVAHEDSATFLAVSSLVGAGCIVARYIIPAQVSSHRLIASCIGIVNIFPVQCNNLVYSPTVSIVRCVLFATGMVMGSEDDWLVMIYLLFAKEEALPLLLFWHGCVHCVSKQREKKKVTKKDSLLPVVHHE